MGRLSNDEFFARLADLFNSPKSSGQGTVSLSQKRLTHDVDTPMPSSSSPSNALFPDLAQPEHPLPILIRATNNKSKDHRADKVRLSTVVQSDALDAFYARYAEVCKAGMVALKPRDRSKKKAKARKKKAPVAAAA